MIVITADGAPRSITKTIINPDNVGVDDLITIMKTRTITETIITVTMVMPMTIEVTTMIDHSNSRRINATNHPPSPNSHPSNQTVNSAPPFSSRAWL
jgi:hypothetical protein